MTGRTLTTEAEEASVLLFKTLGAHRRVVANFRPAPRPRLHSMTRADAEQLQCQATLVRLLSITESFTAQLLLREMDQLVARANSRSADVMWDQAGIRATGSWREQRDAYKKWFDINNSTVDWVPVAERLAEARNAVAHGLGALTRRQLRNVAATERALKAVGIPLVNGRIVLSDATLASAATACRDLITQLDHAMQQRPRRFR